MQVNANQCQSMQINANQCNSQRADLARHGDYLTHWEVVSDKKRNGGFRFIKYTSQKNELQE
ncbi:hypothetical protein QN379_20660 [Glaciimonas sp. Gout2]|uniref:hypothetical protein n=1 Tax=unclassified Glaciimonas TaxID=2644401 RepID=UPI002B23C4B2|nr:MULTISPECIES: hypothetical protein [unclassified Glaciimonas]MEB0014281.1 hypothetical protein [Glaciimonas sp. Cout2]MEB0084424.1 hypothetical protein [Glaciimonas sp. Gout2]